MTGTVAAAVNQVAAAVADKATKQDVSLAGTAVDAKFDMLRSAIRESLILTRLKRVYLLLNDYYDCSAVTTCVHSLTASSRCIPAYLSTHNDTLTLHSTPLSSSDCQNGCS